MAIALQSPNIKYESRIMSRDNNKNPHFDSALTSHLDLCHQEIMYAAQRLSAELLIAKSMSSRNAVVVGGRKNG